MRVVHLACVAPPQTGGIGRVAFEEVLRLRRAGIDAELGSLASDVAPVDGVKRLRAAWTFGNAGSVSWSALDAFVAGADVVHLHYPFFGTAERVAVLKRRGAIKRLVITFHMDPSASGWKEFMFRLYEKTYLPHILRAADAILVSSTDYAANSSAKEFVSKMIELPFGVDTNRFSPGEDASPSFGVPSGAQTISFVGGMDSAHAFKGVDVLLRALVDVPNVDLLLAGDGNLRPSYEKLAQELGVRDRAHFIGRPSDDRLPDVYRASDVFAFPSVSKAEAFGLVALEAQASGIPVVASALPGVRTVVEDGVTGLLVPPGDAAALANALRTLLNDPERSRKMGEAARGRVIERFTWERHVDQLVDLYKKICASPF